jgi:hypothetical protein
MSEEYSEAELFKFMDWLGEKGLINVTTAKSRKIASARILAAIDDHEKLDLRDVDREQVFQRFMNKSGQNFTPGSLTTYKSRFYSSLDDFFNWRANQAGFKPAGMQKSRSKVTEVNDQPSPKKKTKVLKDTVPKDQLEIAGQSLVFPIPIRSGITVKIHNLPMDLSKIEADRICAVVKALAVAE